MIYNVCLEVNKLKLSLTPCITRSSQVHYSTSCVTHWLLINVVFKFFARPELAETGIFSLLPKTYNHPLFTLPFCELHTQSVRNRKLVPNIVSI